MTQPRSVTGDFTAAGQQSAAILIKHLDDTLPYPFNIELRGDGVGTVQLERTFDGINWVPLSAGGSPLMVWTKATGDRFSETWSESEPEVKYRLNCTAYTSGTITYRLSG